MKTSMLASIAAIAALSANAMAQATAVPRDPDNGGPRDWTVVSKSGPVNLREDASPTGNVVAKFAPGTVLDNLNGCTAAAGGVWCDVQKFGGGARGYVSLEFLTPAIAPDGVAHYGPDDSALRAGEGKFNATGQVPCAKNAGQPMGQCEFGVARAGGGYATVVIKWPTGGSRTIYFRMGIPIGASGSQADGYPEMKARKQQDLNLISVGHERFEIPDAVVLGG